MSLWGLPATLQPRTEPIPDEPVKELSLQLALRASCPLMGEEIRENEHLGEPALDADFLNSVGWGDQIDSLNAAITTRSEDFDR